MRDRAPGIRSAARDRHQRERAWAWLSVLTLIICWDAASRLDQHMSPPRVRIAHAGESGDDSRTGEHARPLADQLGIRMR
jgi:hypothetical protein